MPPADAGPLQDPDQATPRAPHGQTVISPGTVQSTKYRPPTRTTEARRPPKTPVTYLHMSNVGLFEFIDSNRTVSLLLARG